MSHKLYAESAVIVPVNLVPLTDDADFKSIEASVPYNAAGLDLRWNFMTPGGSVLQTGITPTVDEWHNMGGGMYALTLPTSINNAVGTGWFTGVATGVLPFAGPQINFVTPNP